MLSILIPTFNDNIAPLVQPLCHELEQLTVPVEIIVGDDCSTQLDPKASLVNLEQVRIFRNPENLGRTATRHLLAEKATFDILLFLDADVVPADSRFIQNYLSVINTAPVVYGGIRYAKESPEKSMRLRWVYGTEREAKPARVRQQNPHFVISPNLMIQRDLFLSLNASHIQRYGWDNVFSFQLFQKSIEVRHIDNPVIHLGLDNSKQYLSKVQKAMETLAWAEKNEMISHDFTSIQKFFNTVQAYGMAGLLGLFIRPWLPLMRWHLESKFPTVRALDLYKFYYFSKYKHTL